MKARTEKLGPAIRSLHRLAVVSAVLFVSHSVSLQTAWAKTVRENLPTTNGTILATAWSGNTLYIGGTFTHVGPASGGAVPVDGLTGDPIPGFPKVEGGVSTAISDGEGGWYIGGRFTHVGGLPRNNLAHILSDYSVAAWNPNVTVPEPRTDGGYYPGGAVTELELVGSTVYVGGRFTHVGGQIRNSLAAVDRDGVLTAWNPNVMDTLTAEGAGRVTALAAHGNTLYIGGRFWTIGGKRRRELAAVDLASGEVTDWNPRTRSYSGDFSMVTEENRLYVAGDFQTASGQERKGIAAFDLATGALTDWDAHLQGSTPDGVAGVQGFALSGHTLFLIGGFCSVGGQPRPGIAAIDVRTAQPMPWNPFPEGQCGSQYANAITASNGTVYISGNFTEVGNQARTYLAALDATTGQPTQWNPDLGGASFLATDGKTVYLCGWSYIVGGVDRNSIAAIDVTTGQVTPWNPDADGAVAALAVSGNTVYVGGFTNAVSGFNRIGGEQRHNLAAIDAVTGHATPWNPNPTGGVDLGFGSGIFSIAVAGGKVYVGGVFSHVGGVDRNSLAELDPLSGDATPWNSDIATLSLPSNGFVRTLMISGSTMYIGGYFETVGGLPRTSLAALDIRTGVPTAWSPAVALAPSWPGLVFALAKNGEDVYVGGYFMHLDGQARNGLGAIDARTGLATPWNPDLRGQASPAPVTVTALAADAHTVYVGGIFAHAGEEARNGLAALDATTGAARSWYPAPFGTGSFSSGDGCALLVHGNTIVAGGSYLWAGDTPKSNLAAAAEFGTEDRGVAASVAPNPMNPRGVLKFRVRATGDVTVRLFDVSGRLVRTLADSQRFDAGEQSLAIDGRDDRGAGLGTGVYFYRIEAPQDVTKGRFTIMK